MDIRIIEQPFHRTLYGTSSAHIPGRPYGPDIIAALDQVWKAVRAGGIHTTGINHVIYDGDAALFAGIEATSEVPAAAGLVMRSVDMGRYAALTAIGPYSGLPAAWARVAAEIERRGLVRGQPGLEIYGHWTADESQLRTDILIPVSHRPVTTP